MTKIFLLTGPPKVGKTSVFLATIKMIRNDGFVVGGMVTSEILKGGQRIGFSLTDLLSGVVGELASVHRKEGPRLGKYRVNLDDLEHIGAAAINMAIEHCDLVAIDEIGPMELFSDSFRQAVERAIESTKPVLATIHLRARGPLLEKIRRHPSSSLWTVNENIRAVLPGILYRRIMTTLRR